MENKKNMVVILLLILVLLIVACIVVSKVIKDKQNNIISHLQTSEKIDVVPTFLEKISTNSAWCGTFQLVWNDMQNEVVGQDIIFNPQISIVENLNKQSFKESDLSEEYYYKIWGMKTLELKDKIEKGIEDKFNQKSDIIDLLDWSDVPKNDSGYSADYKEYLFYTMLYREFNFEKVFSVLDKEKFKGLEKTFEDIEYFGIDKNTDESVYGQVKVLFYNSKEDFAVILNTKEGDQVLLAKGNNGSTFEEIYDNVRKKQKNYSGNSYFTENDTLKVPKIKLDVLREYKELENNVFKAKNGNACEISKALQTIKFELDEKGGKIKSEAVIDMKETAAIGDFEKPEKRFFNFDSTYSIFLLEDGKELPYFAANIDDISLYQD